MISLRLNMTCELKMFEYQINHKRQTRIHYCGQFRAVESLRQINFNAVQVKFF